MFEPVAVIGVTLVVVAVAMDCGKQSAPHVRSLFIVEVLIVRKELGGTENMNSSRHVGVDQAHQLEIAFSRERHDKGLSFCQRSGRQTRGSIERRGAVRRKPGTADLVS